MLAYPINFTGHRVEYLRGIGKTKKEQWKDIEKEIKTACIARRAGVDAPNYQAVPLKDMKDCVQVKYTVYGEEANVKTNPITPKHIDNLLYNFYLMDKTGMCHKFLSSRNIFYNDDGRVQITSLEGAQNFQNINGKFTYKNPDTPEFAMPSNAEGFEERGLCEYVAQFENKNERMEFIKEYLSQKSSYHKQRAELLKDRSLHPSSNTVQLEVIRAKVLENPSDEVVKFMNDKLDINLNRKLAGIMWHEGNGVFDKKPKAYQRFHSATIMLEALKKAVELEDRAAFLAENAKDSNERKYFKFEKQYMTILTDNLYKITKHGIEGNFCDRAFGNNKGLFLGNTEDLEQLDMHFSRIEESDSADEIQNKIDALICYYNELIEYWTPENNAINKLSYINRPVVV